MKITELVRELLELATEMWHTCSEHMFLGLNVTDSLDQRKLA